MVVVTSSICEMAYMVDLPINCLCFHPSLVKHMESIELYVLMYCKHTLPGVIATMGGCDGDLG